MRAEVHLKVSLIVLLQLEFKVSADYAEEIARLEAIIDRFNQPFIDSSAGISEYKQV